MHHPTDMIAHTTAFVTPIVEHWLEREIAQWVSFVKVKTAKYNTHTHSNKDNIVMSQSIYAVVIIIINNNK